MFEEYFHKTVEYIAMGIEMFAVILIAITFLIAISGSIMNLSRQDHAVYRKYKIMIVKVLQTGLEFLVAADIIRTVIVSPTFESVMILFLLIVIRTFLSWTLTLETEGRWPWQKPYEPEIVRSSE